MKKQFIILLFFCTATVLAWVSSGFSWHVYSSGCGACHGGYAEVHPYHNGIDCSACHGEVLEVPLESPATSTCIACHPYPDTGTCPLVNVHEASEFYNPEGASCLNCHETASGCDEPECETDADCNDGLFCNGEEVCLQSAPEEASMCLSNGNPCEANQVCDDDIDQCFETCTETWECFVGYGCKNDVCVEENLPKMTNGPWLAAGSWSRVATTEAKAFTLGQNKEILWSFDDDYATCDEFVTNVVRYQRVGDTSWKWLAPELDSTGKWYASVELPVDRMVDGSYRFLIEMFDCAGQKAYSTSYYFKVAH